MNSWILLFHSPERITGLCAVCGGTAVIETSGRTMAETVRLVPLLCERVSTFHDRCGERAREQLTTLLALFYGPHWDELVRTGGLPSGDSKLWATLSDRIYRLHEPRGEVVP